MWVSELSSPAAGVSTTKPDPRKAGTSHLVEPSPAMSMHICPDWNQVGGRTWITYSQVDTSESMEPFLEAYTNNLPDFSTV
jgi:hypothetical protein